jgi:hypothetical protein
MRTAGTPVRTWFASATLAAAGLGFAGAPAAQADDRSPSAEVGSVAVYNGGEQQVTAAGFPASAPVRVDGLTGAMTARADAAGRVTVAFDVPRTHPPGPARVELRAGMSGAGADFTVVPAPSRDAVLLGAAPPTRSAQASGTVPLGSPGSPARWLRLAGGVLLAAALAALLAGRPRRIAPAVAVPHGSKGHA